MRSLPVEFLELVEEDLRYASDFYNSWQFEGARNFRERFRETIFWIGWNPEMFPRRYKYFRRAIIRRSYFAVFYVIEPNVATVVAVLDMRRDPRKIYSILRLRGKRESPPG
jgi:plasmid stabilization system protein ParE